MTAATGTFWRIGHVAIVAFGVFIWVRLQQTRPLGRASRRLIDGNDFAHYGDIDSCAPALVKKETHSVGLLGRRLGRSVTIGLKRNMNHELGLNAGTLQR